MMNNVEDFEEISDIGDYLKLLKKIQHVKKTY